MNQMNQNDDYLKVNVSVHVHQVNGILSEGIKKKDPTPDDISIHSSFSVDKGTMTKYDESSVFSVLLFSSASKEKEEYNDDISETGSKKKTKTKNKVVDKRVAMEHKTADLGVLASLPLGRFTTLIGTRKRYMAKFVGNAKYVDEPSTAAEVKFSLNIDGNHSVGVYDEDERSNNSNVSCTLGVVCGDEIIVLGKCSFNISEVTDEVLVSLPLEKNEFKEPKKTKKWFFSTSSNADNNKKVVIPLGGNGRSMRVVRQVDRDYFTNDPEKIKYVLSDDATLNISLRVEDADIPPWTVIENTNPVITPKRETSNINEEYDESCMNCDILSCVEGY